MPSGSYDRFKSVELLATQIFDKLPELDGAQADGDVVSGETGHQRGADAATATPFLNADDRDRGTVLALTEKFLGSLLLAIEERNRSVKLVTDARHGPNLCAKDVSYTAAFKRSQLPDGVEPLHGAAQEQSEEEIMSAIRILMTEQEREFREVEIAEKREFNRQVLPPLEPQEAFDPQDVEPNEPALKPGLKARMGATLGRAFRNDYFLAISLSGWSTLSMMVFIDPALSSALCFFSVFLLFVSFCMFSEQTSLRETDQRRHARK